MEIETTAATHTASNRISYPRYSYDKILVIGFAVLAVLSPIFIDRNLEPEIEDDAPTLIVTSIYSYLPLILIILILAIALCSFFEKGFSITFDPGFFYRLVGSSAGIFILILLLSLVLKFKSSAKD